MKKHLLKFLLLGFLTFITVKSFSQADNWTIVTGSVTMEEESTTINEGSRSAKITWTSTSNQDIESDAITVTGDASYSYSLDVYDNTDAGRVRMVLAFSDGTNNYSSVYSVDQASWQTLNITGTVPSAATSVIIRLRFYDESGFSANGNTATVYVDNAIYTENGGSNLVINGGFENWPAPDTDPPVWTTDYPKTATLEATSLDVVANMDEEGTVYYVVLTDGASAPSSAQVIAGTDGSDAAAVTSGNFAVTAASTDFSDNATGLSDRKSVV